jgi:hypothetical protein
MIPSYRNTEYSIEKYHYEVEIFFNTFEVFEPYSHIEKFESENLLESRQNAFKRYEILLAMVERQGYFFLPFARREDFVQGENACYSAQLFLVEDIDGEEELYVIQGEDETTTIDALKSEKEIFERLKTSQS